MYFVLPRPRYNINLVFSWNFPIKFAMTWRKWRFLSAHSLFIKLIRRMHGMNNKRTRRMRGMKFGASKEKRTTPLPAPPPPTHTHMHIQYMHICTWGGGEGFRALPLVIMPLNASWSKRKINEDECFGLFLPLYANILSSLFLPSLWKMTWKRAINSDYSCTFYLLKSTMKLGTKSQVSLTFFEVWTSTYRVQINPIKMSRWSIWDKKQFLGASNCTFPKSSVLLLKVVFSENEGVGE